MSELGDCGARPAGKFGVSPVDQPTPHAVHTARLGESLLAHGYRLLFREAAVFVLSSEMIVGRRCSVLLGLVALAATLSAQDNGGISGQHISGLHDDNKPLLSPLEKEREVQFVLEVHADVQALEAVGVDLQGDKLVRFTNRCKHFIFLEPRTHRPSDPTMRYFTTSLFCF